MSRLRLREFTPFAAAIVVLAGVVAGFALYMHQQYVEAIDRNRRELEGLAFGLSEHLAGVMQSVGQALTHLTERGVHCQSIGIMVGSGALEWARNGVRGVSGVSVLNEKGIVVHSTVPEAIGVDRSARPLFRLLSQSTSRTLVADTPFQGAVSQRTLLAIGLPLLSGGQFCGAVIATIEPMRLMPIYRSLSSHADRTIWLLQQSRVLASFPQDVADPLDLSRLPNTGRGIEQIRSARRHLHTIAYQDIEGSTLAIAASMPVKTALAPWRRDLFLGVLLIALLGAAAGALHWINHRDEQARIASEAEIERQSEARRILFETSLDLILILKDDYTVLQASPSIETTLGMPSAAAAGIPLSQLLHANEARQLTRALQEARANGALRDFDMPITAPDGGTIWMHWSGVWSQAAAKFFLIGRDRTELKRREELLVLQNSRLDAALENMSQGLAMFDRDQRIIVANDKFSTMYGQDPKTVVPGTPLGDIVAQRIKSGLYVGAKVEDVLAKMRERVARQTPSYITAKMGDGRTLAVSVQPQPDGGWVTTHLDITERECLRERLDAALTHMAQGLVMVDRDLRIVLCNSRYLELYGLPPELGTPGTPIEAILRQFSQSGLYGDRSLERLLESTRKRVLRLQAGDAGYHETKLHDGRVIGVSIRSMADGGFVATHEDITERRRIEAKIEHLAHHDSLTELANRAQLCQRLEQSLLEERQTAMLYIDLDRFKAVNDGLGHSVGDALLRAVSERLRGTVGATDLPARLGGDEFAVVHHGDDVSTSAKALATNILAALKQPFRVENHTLSIGASIGIALSPQHGDSIEQILKHADLALYAAKTEQRGTYAVFDPAMAERHLACRVLELELRSGMINHEFHLEYQPIYDLATGRVASCEALLRWQHPRRGNVSPADFIPLAEQSGLITELGAWVIREACREAATWPSEVMIGINLSPLQLRSRDILAIVDGALRATGLPAERLEFEITETTLLDNSDLTLELLRSLHKRGARIALDDFGTGYSSLSYLQRFPFHNIKVDRSFVRGVLDDNSVSMGILRTIAFLGSALGMITTVEGVETEAQLELLRREHFDRVQGFYLSKPLSPALLPWHANAETERLRA